MEFIPMEQVRQQLICPFCSGNEEQTPVQHNAFDAEGNEIPAGSELSKWTVRAVPNKFPSFHEGAGAKPQADAGPFGSNGIVGHQELIIPSPRHVTSLSELSPEELASAFKAIQFRILQVQQDPTIQHIMLFLNCRSAAGASLGHIHFQLIGSPVISPHLKDRGMRNEESLQNHNQTILQRVIEWERGQAVRVVMETENFLVVCPFASRFAFQTWIIPLDRSTGFTDLTADVRDELAETCQRMVAALEKQIGEPAYNLLFHNAPVEFAENDHWYFELFPRLTQAAGFEWGTEIWVNPIAPESAAKRLQL